MGQINRIEKVSGVVQTLNDKYQTLLLIYRSLLLTVNYVYGGTNINKSKEIRKGLMRLEKGALVEEMGRKQNKMKGKAWC